MKSIAGVDFKSKHPLCRLKVGGLQSLSLIDYPGKPACVIFTQGCNFRCGYCYNVELVLPEKFGELIPVHEILRFLERRVGLIEGVVITGGEPTIQVGLDSFISEVKKMGYLVKLDTNGSMSKVLKRLIDEGAVDYVAMDIKAPLVKYDEVVGVKVDKPSLLESIRLIMTSGVEYEFRTTVVKEQLSKEDILQIVELIKGAKKYYLQKFIPGKTLDPNFSNRSTYSDEEFKQILSSIKDYFVQCSLR
ncbi:MAG: anaerobic ribonucleoside-triphosphate reductase activating protein [Acidobacteria bacterium]|jgi:pyruvate formate lyase activating enzyme|nr:MAG: anaerobic ribonucleoside-triphosphate reductase activating protein [Acidobacteriota bacterium]